MTENKREAVLPKPPLIEKSKKEGGKRIAARLTEFGRGEAKKHWEGLLKEVGSDADLAEIREAAGSAIQEFKEDSQYADEKDFLRLIELSFERRLDYLERTQLLEEMKVSNSPWRRSLKVLQEKLYPDLPPGFVNYFAAPMILSLKKSINGFLPVAYEPVAYENEIERSLTAFLRQTKPEELREIKDKEGLRGLTSAALYWRYGSEELPIVEKLGLSSPRENQVAALRAEDIVLPEPKRKPSRLRKAINRLIPSAGFRRKAVQAILTGVLVANLLISSVGPIKRAEEIKSAVSLPSIVRVVQLPTPDWQMALALAPVNVTPPPLSEQTAVAEKPEERPHFLQDPQLAALYEQGCLSLYEADIDGDGQPDVKILDYPATDATTPLCAEKLVLEEFGQEHPAQERLHQFQLADNRELAVVKQTPSACAIHAKVMAASLLTNPKDESGLPVVINPFLIGEVLKITDEEYTRIVEELSNEEKMRLVYGSDIDEASRSGAINLAMQTSRRSEFSRLLSILGINFRKNVDLIPYLQKTGGDVRIQLGRETFTNAQWERLAEAHEVVSLSLPEDLGEGISRESMVLPGEEARKVYKGYLLRRYQELKRSNNIVLLGMQSSQVGIFHLYVLLGIKEVNDRQYFHAIEGRAGEPAQWGYYEGQLIRNEDGSLYIPLDQLYRWRPSFDVMTKTNGGLEI